MKNRGLLAVKIGNRIYNRSHESRYLGERKTLFRLLLAQLLQVWSIDIVHENVRALQLLILKDTIHTGKSLVIEPLQYVALKNKSISILPCQIFSVRLYHLFK